jgi:hypothetical protein
MKNEITLLSNTYTSQHYYKKHPAGLDLIQVPVAILATYHKCCEYRYITVSGFGEVPMPSFAILGVNYNKIGINTIPLVDYANGFIKGYNSSLIPFIDNIDTRKEVVLHESIFKGGKGFVESHNEKGIEYKAESMYKSGLFEGKRYKAWEIIFETPSAFIQYFEPLSSREKKVLDNANTSKVADIKKEKTVSDYTSQDKSEIISQKPESAIPGSISFTKKNYESVIQDWNMKHNNNLTKWLKNGQMVKIEEWHYLSTERLNEQKQVLNNLYDLIDMPLINMADLHDEIIDTCLHYANSIETSLDRFYADSKDMQISTPFSSLCPKIIKQPKYLIQAYLKHPKDLPENQIIYYRYKYLNSKLGFAKGKFNEYKQNLNRSIIIETSNNNKDIINSMFLFIELFIDNLKSLYRTQFNYFASPLFRLLFDEVIKFKGYYIAAFGNFTFTNILEIEDALKTLGPLLIDTELSINEAKEETVIKTIDFIENPKSKIVAICAFFLSESKIIKHNSSQELSEKVITLLQSNYKASTIKKYYNIIKSKNIDKVLTPVNIQIAIQFLGKYPHAQKLAQEHLSSIEFI